MGSNESDVLSEGPLKGDCREEINQPLKFGEKSGALKGDCISGISLGDAFQGHEEEMPKEFREDHKLKLELNDKLQPSLGELQAYADAHNIETPLPVEDKFYGDRSDNGENPFYGMEIREIKNGDKVYTVGGYFPKNIDTPLVNSIELAHGTTYFVKGADVYKRKFIAVIDSPEYVYYTEKEQE